MEKTIIVSKLIKNGLTESNGLVLREYIKNQLDSILDNDIIILDFSNITLFATPFFNASIGYFILTLGPNKFEKIFKLGEITKLGKDTYNHSYENAIEIYNKKVNIQEVEKVINKNIGNM